jgi:DNA gyrase subunit A
MGRKKTDNIDEPIVQENIDTKELSEALATNFMRYAYAVLEDRAIPDARDGFKPSQRRVLIAMDDLKLYSSGQTQKCAKICGDCSGNYHPHGEAIVYPTLTRLAQDWVMRYPLITPQGNFGNMDPESKPAAMRYCIVGDTILLNSDGLVPMKDVNHVNGKTNIKVLSANNIVNSATDFFDCGKWNTQKVITKHGYEITGTLNHPLLIMTSNSLTFSSATIFIPRSEYSFMSFILLAFF